MSGNLWNEFKLRKKEALKKKSLHNGKQKGNVYIKEKDISTCYENTKFLNELKFLSKLNHENIVKFCGIEGTSANKNNGFIWTEYSDCGSLYTLLYESNRNISFSCKLSWMLQCAKVLAYLHGKKPSIFHNDLNTGHLLLSNRYKTVKLCDFSTASDFDLNTQIVEQAEIYNFGYILWETLIEHKNNQRELDVEDTEAIETLIKLCCDQNAINRPKMRVMVTLLEGVYQQSLRVQSQINWTDIKLDNKEIGSGSFGDVFKGIWKTKQGDIDIAVKRFKNISKEVDIEKELKYMSLINHENIVKLHGSTIDHQHKTLAVMEYADCGSLYDFLHRKLEIQVSNWGKLNWLLQCAKALDYLHGMSPKPILHRDLKSQNLLLFNKGLILKICDFGTVKPLQTEMTDGIGTAGYIAPEVCDGKAYTEKCDVYSFGILCWEVMSQKKPFYHLNERLCMVIMKQTCDNKRPSMDDIETNEVTNPIRAWIPQCWDQYPTKRPTMKQMVISLGIDPPSYKDYLLRPLKPISKNDFTEKTVPRWIPN